MDADLEEKIANALIHILSDGFNRSMNELEEAGAIDLRELRAAYSGVGSEYYDLVTAQLEQTAKDAMPAPMRGRHPAITYCQVITVSIHSERRSPRLTHSLLPETVGSGVQAS